MATDQPPTGNPEETPAAGAPPPVPQTPVLAAMARIEDKLNRLPLGDADRAEVQDLVIDFARELLEHSRAQVESHLSWAAAEARKRLGL